MPYQTTLPGLGESRLDGYKAIMVSKLSDLNSVITLVQPSLPLGVTLNSDCIHIGDVETMPSETTEPCWFAIESGGKNDGRDMDIDLKSSGPVFDRKIWTNLYWYLHPNAFGGLTDAFLQGEYRTRLRERVSDWIMGDCFNNKAGLAVTLDSQEYDAAGDVLGWSYVRRVTKGFVQKSFGGTVWVYHTHFELGAEIFGNIG